MGQARIKADRRQLRKALTPDVADVLVAHGIRINAHTAILRRGFWGRLKWLVFGR